MVLIKTLLYTRGIWEKAVKLVFGQQWNLNQTPLGLSAPVVFDSNSTVTLKSLTTFSQIPLIYNSVSTETNITYWNKWSITEFVLFQVVATYFSGEGDLCLILHVHKYLECTTKFFNHPLHEAQFFEQEYYEISTNLIP